MIEQQPSQDDKTIAILTHLSPILFGFIVPLVVWLISKDSKPWLSSEAKEALNFQIWVTIAYVVAYASLMFLVGLILLPAVWGANLAFCAYAAYRTSQGAAPSYPAFMPRLIK